ncbi:hypothetical protein [Peribacillus sp. JNUCC41]|uniref:hypothetical protein n=1 Tax=Peribacillus sp. JNUCC41 TaxID=2778370 RepID=UPI00177A89A9|nr:hypothetical protein [Brevibacillus sp. JNUCC-41]QOS88991.1 hypothetical protein JNUCC41_19690 [Brevibacillus sp. JNUCC-41]
MLIPIDQCWCVMKIVLAKMKNIIAPMTVKDAELLLLNINLILAGSVKRMFNFCKTIPRHVSKEGSRPINSGFFLFKSELKSIVWKKSTKRASNGNDVPGSDCIVKEQPKINSMIPSNTG